jgi:hypothetical protein
MGMELVFALVGAFVSGLALGPAIQRWLIRASGLDDDGQINL